MANAKSVLAAKFSGKSALKAKLPAAITLTVNGAPIVATLREFSTGSLGYYANGKAAIDLGDGVVITLQVGANITCAGSKDLGE